MAGDYQVRRSERARRLRITVGPHGVEVVAPKAAREADIVAFVHDHRAWIEAKLGAIRRQLAHHPGSDRLIDGAQIPLRGALQRLQITRTIRIRPTVHDEDGLRVELPIRVPVAEEEREVERILTGWLRREARRDAQAMIDHHGPRHDLHPRGLVIKAHRTLWGSCTAQDVINLNWRLILAPPAALEYVVVHELCHLRHRHHQPPFWREVARILPDYGQQRRWLRANGHLLTLKAPQAA